MTRTKSGIKLNARTSVHIQPDVTYLTHHSSRSQYSCPQPSNRGGSARSCRSHSVIRHHSLSCHLGRNLQNHADTHTHTHTHRRGASVAGNANAAQIERTLYRSPVFLSIHSLERSESRRSCARTCIPQAASIAIAVVFVVNDANPNSDSVEHHASSNQQPRYPHPIIAVTICISIW